MSTYIRRHLVTDDLILERRESVRDNLAWLCMYLTLLSSWHYNYKAIIRSEIWHRHFNRQETWKKKTCCAAQYYNISVYNGIVIQSSILQHIYVASRMFPLLNKLIKILEYNYTHMYICDFFTILYKFNNKKVKLQVSEFFIFITFLFLISIFCSRWIK